MRGDVHGELIDTLALAREMFPGKRNNLDALCERFGIDNAHRTLHGALLDAELLAEVYLAMTRGQETLTIDIGAPPPRRGGAPPTAWRSGPAGRGGPLKVIEPTAAENLRRIATISPRWTWNPRACASGSRSSHEAERLPDLIARSHVADGEARAGRP